MDRKELRLCNEHMFAFLGEDLFLLDTGSPTTFSSVRPLTIDGRRFPVDESFSGVRPQDVSDLVGLQVSGLLGVDVLNEFDIIMDIPGGTIAFSTQPLDFGGEVVDLKMVMNLPTVLVQVGETALSVLLDTGAQISYLEDELLANCEPAGCVGDFHPIVGRFTTRTYRADIHLGSRSMTVRCGGLSGLPDLLLKNLLAPVPGLAGVRGVLSNEPFRGFPFGYFPRRSQLVLPLA